jgi:hypothetical protein
MVGRDYEYQDLVDGIEIMKTLARDLTGIKEDEEQARRQVEAEQRRAWERQQAEQRRAWERQQTEQRLAREKQEEERRVAEAKRKQRRSRFFSLGLAAGSTFTVPWGVVNLNATLPLFGYTFFDVGVDFGFIHGYPGRSDLGYVSLYPYARLNGYLPMGNTGGFYFGAGAGYMAAYYAAGDEKNEFKIPAVDVTAGLFLGRENNYFRIAYALRAPVEAPFSVQNHRVIFGYSYRWE